MGVCGVLTAGGMGIDEFAKSPPVGLIHFTYKLFIQENIFVSLPSWWKATQVNMDPLYGGKP